ncbi:hypothetical protein Q1695_006009 [Nippostrongylus brasiliensis]|nr:hypothetical protein Q1695_006009 [Nippostrongylus brasiliensis]
MPVTRGGAQSTPASLSSNSDVSETDVSQQYSVNIDSLIAPLSGSLSTLDDNAVVHGREAKVLRDATSAAISQVWNDARSQTSSLASSINESTLALSRRLNDSFSAVGDRLESTPMVATLGADGSLPGVRSFSGSADDGQQFSIWLRRLEDVLRMRTSNPTEEYKANFLIGHLEGVAREKIEELPAEKRNNFSELTAFLRAYFESPQQRYVALQKLSSCEQEIGESCSAFANKILNLVRAATAGQDVNSQKERARDDFVARLRGDIRYFVKLDNPLTFEQAVEKAQTVEQLIAEASAERLMHPTRPVAEVQALAGTPPPRRVTFRTDDNRQDFRSNSRSSSVGRSRSFQNARTGAGYRRPNQDICFNCGGVGHYRRQCPWPTYRTPRDGRMQGSRFQSSSFPTDSRITSRPNDPRLMSCTPTAHSQR